MILIWIFRTRLNVHCVVEAVRVNKQHFKHTLILKLAKNHIKSLTQYCSL
jgi:hypothetical protein